MLTCSLDVWPGSYSLADEIQIPIKFDFRPFDTESKLGHATQSLVSCTTCGAIATALFPHDNGTMTCPFCQTSSPYERDHFSTISEFQRESECGQSHFFLCFLLDLTCAEELIDVSKIHFFSALKALLPGTAFTVALLEEDRVSFVKVFHNGTKFLTFSLNACLFKLIDVSFLMNSINNIEIIEEMINKFQTKKKRTEIHEIADFSKLFSNPSSNVFVKFLVFSPNFISSQTASRMSLDWFSPFPDKKRSMPIDGIFLSVNTEDVELHLQALVQRYKTTDFAMNLSVRAFIAKPLEISPNTYTRVSVRDGASQALTVTVPKGYHRNEPVPVQIESRYVILGHGDTCIQRTVVISKSIPISKDVAPILRGVNPVVVKQSMDKDTEETFVRNLLGLYNSKIVEILPGRIDYDPFFRLMPHLQLFLRFFAAKDKVTNGNIILGNDLAIARYIPCVSFWETQDRKIEEAAPSPSWSTVLFQDMECIVSDCGDKIHIFMDTEIRPGSQLQKEIERRVQRRFPIVPVLKHQKMRIPLFLQNETEITELIIQRFGKKRSC